MRGRSGVRLRLVTAVALVASMAGGAAMASAAEDVGGYADWTMDGSGNDYSGTMTLPGNFPAASFTSDARAASQLNSGTSTWLSEGTPFGEVFGGSRGKPYPTLRPYADRPGAPSTTTFTFDSATPAEGWGFTLGDIDADTVEVSAADAAGDPVPVAGLGFQAVFNYCDASPRPSTCSGVTEYHQPTWVAGATSGRLVGDGDDEVGGAGWFRPTAAIKTLTFRFTRLTGFPVYQIWFARLADPDVPDPTDSPSDDPSDDPSESPSDSPSDDPSGSPSDDPSESPSGSAGGGSDGGDATGGDGPWLPVTGANASTTAATGLALVLGGAALLWTARRRGPRVRRH